MIARDSVFLRALGDEAQHLHPKVREYAAGPPSGGDAGRGRGVFHVAGSPYRRLAALLRIASGPGVALTRFERNVPFEITNHPTLVGGQRVLRAERVFRFRGGEQRFEDTLQAGLAPGTLVNVLGVRGRVELLLECSATPEGNLRLRSRGARVRFGDNRYRLPRLFSVCVEAVDGWDASTQRRTIDVVVRNPILGVVMRYHGWFHYE